ncbi:MAG: hypothetical protein KC591_09645 [Gemmatimonadetes bacterium]|nr:hypothetical protein [Gemmatimonadota bacterium]
MCIASSGSPVLLRDLPAGTTWGGGRLFVPPTGSPTCLTVREDGCSFDWTRLGAATATAPDDRRPIIDTGLGSHVLVEVRARLRIDGWRPLFGGYGAVFAAGFTDIFGIEDMSWIATIQDWGGACGCSAGLWAAASQSPTFALASGCQEPDVRSLSSRVGVYEIDEGVLREVGSWDFDFHVSELILSSDGKSCVVVGGPEGAAIVMARGHSVHRIVGEGPAKVLRAVGYRRTAEGIELVGGIDDDRYSAWFWWVTDRTASLFQVVTDGVKLHDEFAVPEHASVFQISAGGGHLLVRRQDGPELITRSGRVLIEDMLEFDARTPYVASGRLRVLTTKSGRDVFVRGASAVPGRTVVYALEDGGIR